MVAKLLKVAPITKGFSKELSYFSLKKIKEGDVIFVPIKGRNSPALVLSVENARDAKAQLRSSPFPLKRVSNSRAYNLFTPEFVKASQKTAERFFVDVGRVIKESCPRFILENPIENKPTQEKNKNKLVRAGGKNSILALQASKKERIRFYKNLIRAEFAKGQSILLCLSSISEVGQYEEELKKGLEPYTIALHSKIKKKELRERWLKTLKEKHPVLIIATGLFLSIPRKNIGAIIVENEGSSLYKSKNKPYLDIRIMARNLSFELKNTLILADEIIRTETYNQILLKKISEATPSSPKIISRAQQMLVDMKKDNYIISDELQKMLGSAQENNEQVILFVNRRGHGSSTVCGNCGKILVCPNCEIPLVLHKEPSPKFLCHKCLFAANPIDHCPYCKSWNLKILGRGIQQINEEIQKLFPKFKIFRLDSDIAKNRKQGEKILENFRNTTGSILVATQLLFSFPTRGVERVGVVSIDGLFNLPDFRINEKIFRLLLRLKMKARKTFLIQTRLPEYPVFDNVMKGDIGKFYQSELLFRKALGYPPFKTLIKIIVESKNKSQAQKEMDALVKKLENYKPIKFPMFAPKIKNNYRLCLLLKLEPSMWLNPQNEEQKQKRDNLRAILSSLPSKHKIDIGPESLL